MVKEHDNQMIENLPTNLLLHIVAILPKDNLWKVKKTNL